jgi:mannose-1-phosphate guanylyltransferase
MINAGTSSPRNRRYAIIMAGGDGTRLASLTRAITGHEVPKQFCALLGEQTLLEQTHRRVALAIAPEDTLTVVSRKHRAFYTPLLRDVPSRNVVVQPSNRGTAPALLYSLLRLAASDPDASVAVMPSDHYLSNEREFMRHVEAAYSVVEGRPELTVMLGMAALAPETSYGWIEPGNSLFTGNFVISSVRNFVGTPPLDTAIDLMRRGSLWNSCVIVARLSTLIGLIMMAEPQLYFGFSSIRHLFGTAFEGEAVDKVYLDAPERSFAHDILTSCPVNLAVMPVRGVAFTDLGEAHRVLDTARRIGITPKWMAQAAAI